MIEYDSETNPMLQEATILQLMEELKGRFNCLIICGMPNGQQDLVPEHGHFFGKHGHYIHRTGMVNIINKYHKLEAAQSLMEISDEGINDET